MSPLSCVPRACVGVVPLCAFSLSSEGGRLFPRLPSLRGVSVTVGVVLGVVIVGVMVVFQGVDEG